MRFETPIEERVHRRLGMLGPGPAEFFRDACRLRSNPDFLDTTAHLIAHCLREIESALQHLLLPSSYVSEKRGSNDAHRKKVEAILEVCGIAPDTPPAKAWLKVATSGSPLQLHKRAHRNNLQEARALDAEASELWKTMLILLDATLDRLEAQFTEHIRVAEALAVLANPTNRDLDVLKEKVPHNYASLSRFFELATSGWLLPLHEAGYFLNPPPRETSSDGGYYRFPPWPASKYLARLASQPLDEETRHRLAQAAASIPENDNTWVRADVLGVALAVDVSHATAIGERALHWIDRETAGRRPERFAELAVRVTNEGNPEAGLRFLRSLLRVQKSGYFGAGPESLIDEYEFQIVVKKWLPPFVQSAGADAFVMLCDALEAAATIDGDNGWGRRRAIETHAQDKHESHRPLSLLVDAVRDAATALCARDASAIAGVLRELERRSPSIFARLAMYMARLNPDRAMETVAKYLLDDQYLDEHEVWHERRLLERDCLAHLAPEHREAFFSALRQRAASFEDPSSRASWIRRHLELIQGLPDDLKAEFEQVASERGHHPHPEFAFFISVGRGFNDSPSTHIDASSLRPDTLNVFLNEWERGDARARDRESCRKLSQELVRAVCADPEAYAQVLPTLTDSKPAHVRALIEGFHEAHKAKKKFNWEHPLALCQWVAQLPSEDTVDTVDAIDRGVDPGWRWAQKQACELITLGTDDGPGSLGESDMGLALGAIGGLIRTQDADVSGSGDPYSQAVNSLRGKATETLVRFALWMCRRQRQKKMPGDLGSMPQVRSLLEASMEPSLPQAEHSFAMLGRYLPNLVAIDRAWVEAHLPQLFPPGQRGLVTIQTYVQWNAADPVMFALLERILLDAMPQIARPERSGARSLVDHLGPLYLSGDISLDSPFLCQFFVAVEIDARAALLKEIGFSLFHSEGQVDAVVLERAQTLWSRRFSAFQAGDAAPEELAPFGWWFAAGQFDDRWSLAELEKLLTTTTDIEPDHLVADRLGAVAEKWPIEALRCLLLLCEGDSTGWRVTACRDGLAKAVGHAREGSDPIGRQFANEVISRLVAQGHTDLLGLL